MNSAEQNDTKVILSVCGGVLKDPSRYPRADFHSEQVYFCSSACLRAFLEAPEAFIAGEIEHPDSDEDI